MKFFIQILSNQCTQVWSDNLTTDSVHDELAVQSKQKCKMAKLANSISILVAAKFVRKMFEKLTLGAICFYLNNFD